MNNVTTMTKPTKKIKHDKSIVEPWVNELITKTEGSSSGLGIPINNNPSPFVPVSKPIIGQAEILEHIAIGVRENLPVLLIGETGTGKTSLIRFLASNTNNSLHRVNLNGATGVEELVGHRTVEAGSIKWVEGLLPFAMKNGHWLILDEINACKPEILFALHSVLDDDRMLLIPENENEIVKPHPNFRIFATMNPSFDYAGTQELNKAFLSRFPITLQVDNLDALSEVQALQAHVPNIQQKDALLLIKVAENLRQAKMNNQLSFVCSTRELINWARLIALGVPIDVSSKIVLINKCDSESDKTTVRDTLKVNLKYFGENAVPSLDEILKSATKVSDLEKELESTKIKLGVEDVKSRVLGEQLNKLKGLAEQIQQMKQEDTVIV